MPRGPKKIAAREDSEETRHTILRTAEQLFMEYGYRAVSTRQIADACGLTQPALYHYFADKQMLYVEVIKENTTKTQTALERIVRRNEGVAERLSLVVRYLHSTTQHDIGLMLHDIQHELSPQMQELLNDLFNTCLIAPIASVFEDGIRQGLLRHPQQGGLDAINSAYLLMTMLPKFIDRPQSQEGSALHSNRYGATIEQAEMVVQVLLYGLVREQTREQQIITLSADKKTIPDRNG
ncbi:TetR family transcriptional regulator [Dictyobacter alpinus]|uniref:TetR family transcriptional regulator n=1 Tax=Dictyobacter alpinus TaxID=2014873 RepID=A0A402B5Q7_9CHLR|nr:TetR/AcrR family transcriptional regulator [Dictyobacter alpinus]GCE26669.1 TetR family transcriptional regulator [Dictyobacter alpinus]